MKRGIEYRPIETRRRKIALISFSGLLIISFAILALNNSINPKSLPLTGHAILMQADSTTQIDVDFSKEIGAIREDFYGVNLNNQLWFRENDDKLIGVYDNSTKDVYSNSTWHKDTYLDSNMGSILVWDSVTHSVGDGYPYYYTSILGGDAENWVVGTTYNATSGMSVSCSIPVGLGCTGYKLNSSTFATFSQSTDAHFGGYSVNITTFDTNKTKEAWSYYEIQLPFNHYYNFSVWFKSKNDTWLRIVNEDTDLINCSDTNDMSGDWKQYSCAINYTASKGYVEGTYWRIDIGWLHGGESGLWDDFQITQDGNVINYWHNDEAFIPVRENIKFAYENNKKVVIRVDNMPTFLANVSNLCSTSIETCPPNNYTIWGDLLVDWINVSTEYGLYLSTISGVEIGNEFYLPNEWLHDDVIYDSANKSIEYNILYNASWMAIKQAFPNLAVGGGCAYYGYPNMITNWLSNFPQQMNFVSFHPYMYNYESNTNGLYNKTKWLFDLCEKYNANCSRIINSEWSISNIVFKNSSENYERFGTNIALAYSDILNNWPENVSMINFEWAYPYKYSNQENFREYPQRWSMVSEPTLDNEYYPSYNVTKNFATHHSAGSMVVKSNSSTSGVKVVASKKGKEQHITVINTGANASAKLNVTGNISGAIKDLETGDIYMIKNGMAEIGNISQYQIRYFVNYSAQETENETKEGDNESVNETNEDYEEEYFNEAGVNGGEGNSQENAEEIRTNPEEPNSNEVYGGGTRNSLSEQEENTKMKSGVLTGKAISESWESEGKMPVFLKVGLLLFAFGLLFLTVDILYNVYWPPI